MCTHNNLIYKILKHQPKNHLNNSFFNLDKKEVI